MKKKVIKTLKIIGILLLVAIILFIKFILIPALDTEANNYQNVLEYGEIINFTFPKTGDCFIENMKYDEYYENMYVYKLGFIFYNNQEANEMLSEIKNNKNWISELPDELSVYDTTFGMTQYDYYLIYNNTTKEYNMPLNNENQMNEIYYLAYDIEKMECVIAIYDIEG